MDEPKRITYKLRCSCPFCYRTRIVTLPEGQEPNEWCSGRKMWVEASYPAEMKRPSM